MGFEGSNPSLRTNEKEPAKAGFFFGAQKPSAADGFRAKLEEGFERFWPRSRPLGSGRAKSGDLEHCRVADTAMFEVKIPSLHSLPSVILPLMFAYLSGSIIPLSDAKIPVTDIGISRGYGVYDGMTSYAGKPFRFDDHIRRLRSSAAALGLSIAESDSQIYAALIKLIELNKFPRTNFRLIVTGGKTISGIEFDPAAPTFIILAEEHKYLPESLYEKGGTLISEEFMRYMPEHKTTNYIHAVHLQDKRKAAGAIEILYCFDDNVYECATSNVFAVKEGVLITPREKVLAGITRKVVIELAREQGIKVEERPVTMKELLAADECFITASFKEIVPIISVDGIKIGTGVPGAVTKSVSSLFKAYTEHA